MKFPQPLIIGLALILSVGPAYAALRVVSTAGSASEIVVELGFADALVGVDTTSIKPHATMAEIPKVGYRRKLSSEGVLSLNPDLLILAPDAGPEEVVKQILSANITTITIEDKQTLAGIRADIKLLANALNADPTALLTKVGQDELELAQTLAAFSRPAKVLVLIDTGSNQLTALGDDSAGEHLLTILHAENVLNMQGMKPLSKEVLATLKPDAILLARRSEANSAATISVLADNEVRKLSLSPNITTECIFDVSIVDALGFGPYTAHYANSIAKVMQPCVD